MKKYIAYAYYGIIYTHSLMKNVFSVSQKRYVMYYNGFHFWNQHARIS